jgi:hypothetical protein
MPHVTTLHHKETDLATTGHILVFVKPKHGLTLYLTYNMYSNGIIWGSRDHTHTACVPQNNENMLTQNTLCCMHKRHTLNAVLAKASLRSKGYTG